MLAVPCVTLEAVAWRHNVVVRLTKATKLNIKPVVRDLHNRFGIYCKADPMPLLS